MRTGRKLNSTKLRESYKDFDSSAINSYVKGWLNHTDGDFETISDLLRDLNDYLFEGLQNVVVLEARKYYDQAWVTPNIQRAYCNEDGCIRVEIGADTIFEDFEACKDGGFDFTKDNDLIQFCRELGSVIVHEMVHWHQFTQFQNRPAKENYYEYLMLKDEIDAHAIAAVEEARSLGYSDKELLDKLSNDTRDLMIELDSLYKYISFYGSDDKADQRVIKRLLKTMSNHILNDSINESRLKRRKLHKSGEESLDENYENIHSAIFRAKGFVDQMRKYYDDVTIKQAIETCLMR